jgi:hypothetical protein
MAVPGGQDLDEAVAFVVFLLGRLRPGTMTGHVRHPLVLLGLVLLKLRVNLDRGTEASTCTASEPRWKLMFRFIARAASSWLERVKTWWMRTKSKAKRRA